MKQLQNLLALAMFCFLLTSCSKETETIETSPDPVEIILVSAKDQFPNQSFDNAKSGIYHGMVASTTTQTRGKIWINIGNDDNYNAIAQLVDGPSIEFKLGADVVIDDTTRIFQFESEHATFEFDLTDFTNPIVRNFTMDAMDFASTVVKSRSMSNASVVTAIFTEPLDPLFSGTWSLISDGVTQNPNGIGGDAITSLTVTLSGVTYTDTDFNPFNSTDCLGMADFIPVINGNGVANSVHSSYQVSEFDGGIAKWDLGFDPSGPTYHEYRNCEEVTLGSINWVNPVTGESRFAVIFVDTL